MLMVDGDGDILTATARGFGKRTAVSEFPQKGRGTQGVIAIQTSERNGELVGAIQLTDAHDVMLISNQGTLVRTRAGEISQVGRNTQGVTLIRLPDDERLVGLERLDALPEEEGERPEGEAPQPPAP
jgi:DNA gyrase subunit A